ncbi:pre-mRNA-processing factor 19 [Plasmodium brasilianum]|uniref:Pre-mRNA-processing factor 19 n=2 Tax=Plasmodium (Plasmodium) TaxID=418103 RepID=A0A1C3KYQ4_PLAMA|nr:pre-mRNA-processing factor 19, putative [Plasmodium malariae]KAI4838998.1 pre-mRNA-processing factor 19 [Plasmodium brasilianum]SBT79386.1 pre-mRNA-processing factor 19, putative [Plasmodium malariae]SCN12348.1 pre-mRNA-processing factor 19, putative [Plasmodium malariae]
MSILCTISGQTPEEPVVSKTGYIFEKRLIEKHIINYGICPVSGEILTLQDLYPLKNEKIVKPRPISASSIPGLLSMFQTEWDSIISEMFSLRTHVNDIRNQLSHSLYQYDAATRVIAKLLKEKDSYKEEITNLRNQIFQLKSGNDINEFEIGITDELLNEMQNIAKDLLMNRKKRKIENVCSVDKWKEFTNTNEFDIHSSVVPGVTSLALDINKYKYNYNHDHINHNFFSGGKDGNIYYVSLSDNKIISKLQGHLKKVNALISHPSNFVCISGSNDKTVRIWKGDSDTNEYVTAHVITKHKDHITSLSLHPLENLFISASKDNVWILHDLETAKTIKTCKNNPSPFKNLSIHPDGMMLGIASEDSNIHIYDIKSQEYKASLTGHTKAVDCISFSENGYYLASCSKDNTIKLWDLRKALSFQTLELEQTPNFITFDYSGKYLSVALGNDIHIYNFHTKNQVTLVNTLSSHTDTVTKTCFGSRTSYLLSSSMDKTVKLWS